MNPKLRRFLVKSTFGIAAIWVAFQFIGSAGTGRTVVQVAPLLERVQALGDLHAVKYTYRDVHEYESARDATPWLASLPGGNEVVQAATRNTAVMSFTGTVEAGVDLGKAKIQRSETGVTITLPRPEVYPPNVSADVHDVKRGLFWRDQGIAASAIEDAKVRFRSTSIRQGILDEAKTNVRKQVGDLVRDVAGVPATITFDDDPPAARDSNIS